MTDDRASNHDGEQANDVATIAAARAAADDDRLGAWVSSFLATPGSDNAELGEQLTTTHRVWIGPMALPFDRLHRLAGPPDQPTLERLTDDDVDTVEAMEESIDDGWDPAPFIVTWDDDHLVLEDGNHRVEGLRRAGHDRYWCVVGFESEAARQGFDEAAQR